MKREQAERINDHFLDAHAALDDARIAIASLGKAERIKLDGLLDEVVFDLQRKLLAPIYEQYPDLEPPEADEERPTVFSELTWSEVRLPPSVTERQLDEIIFSLMSPRWRKPAAIAFLAMERCRELGVPITGEVIAA